jgi:hypothetical protein
MAEKEVDVPGVGRVKSSYVVAAVAAAGGFIAFAWWRRRSSTEVPGMIPVVDPSQIPATDYVPPGGSGATGHQDLTGDAIDTNAEWFQAATDYLGRLGGWENKLIASALGKFLDRKELTPEEVDVVRAARGAIGDPPVNGPWEIKVGVPSAPERTVGPIKNLRATGATRDHITLTWDPVTGATRYVVEMNGRAGKHKADFDYASTNTYTSGPLPYPNFEYTYRVRAQKNEENGPESSITAKTTA